MTNITPEYVLTPFKHLLAQCQNNVLIGLRLCERMEKFPEPTSEELKFKMGLSMNGYLSNDTDSSKFLFKKWVLRNGFEEVHNSIRITLERLLVYLNMQKMLVDGVTLDALSEKELELRKLANKYHFPELIKSINNLIDEPLKLEGHIASINNARNCFVHRNGFVIDKDCNRNDKLVIIGRKFKMFFKDGDKEVPAEVGVTGPIGASLMVGAEDFSLEFNVGQVIDLSLEQFMDLLQTCIFLNAEIGVKLGSTT